MRHQNFNIIFQPPKETTSGFVIIKKCRFKSNKYSKYKFIKRSKLARSVWPCLLSDSERLDEIHVLNCRAVWVCVCVCVWCVFHGHAAVTSLTVAMRVELFWEFDFWVTLSLKLQSLHNHTPQKRFIFEFSLETRPPGFEANSRLGHAKSICSFSMIMIFIEL